MGMTWGNEKKRHASYRFEVDEYMNDTLEDIICDIGVDAFKKAYVKDTLQSDMEESLFPRCKYYTRYLIMLILFTLKVKCGWTDRSFT